MFSRGYVLGMVLGAAIASLLYGLLFYHYHLNVRPSPGGEDDPAFSARAVPPAAGPEFDEEIERLARSMEEGSAGAAEAFRELSRKVRGGEEWLLLKMAAIANSRKVYSPLAEKVVPLVRLSLEKVTRGGNAVFSISIHNPTDTYIHIARVPTEAKLVFSRAGSGTAWVLPLDLSLFGDTAEKKVLTIYPGGFWGVTVSCPLKDFDEGPVQVEACLRYAETSLDGYNLTAGEFQSESVTVRM